MLGESDQQASLFCVVVWWSASDLSGKHKISMQKQILLVGNAKKRKRNLHKEGTENELR